MSGSPQFSDLIGMTLVAVLVQRDHATKDDEIVFLTDKGRRFCMYHPEDCCEHVSINDIEGDVADLIGSPVTLAEESSNGSDDGAERPEHDYCDDSWTWTFYRIATAKGFVTIRWFGSSNGYYSEAVYFAEAGGA